MSLGSPQSFLKLTRDDSAGLELVGILLLLSPQSWDYLQAWLLHFSRLLQCIPTNYPVFLYTVL